jgi:hypothetical protein
MSEEQASLPREQRPSHGQANNCPANNGHSNSHRLIVAETQMRKHS